MTMFCKRTSLCPMIVCLYNDVLLYQNVDIRTQTLLRFSVFVQTVRRHITEHDVILLDIFGLVVKSVNIN